MNLCTVMQNTWGFYGIEIYVGVVNRNLAEACNFVWTYFALVNPTVMLISKFCPRHFLNTCSTLELMGTCELTHLTCSMENGYSQKQLYIS